MDFIQWRFVFVALMSAGVMVLNVSRVNISVALLSMVNATMFASKDPNSTSECFRPIRVESVQSSSRNIEGSFLWTADEQSSVLSAFFWGYAVLQIPTGILTMYVDIKRMFVISNIVFIVFTILTPVAAKFGVNYLIIARFIIGLGQSPFMSCMYALAGKWVLEEERSITMSIMSAGSALGLIVGNSLSGYLAATVGWEWIFYVIGIASLVWCFFVILFITNDPSEHPFMSKKEKSFFANRNSTFILNNKLLNRRLWLKIFTSPPFYGVICIHTSYNFTWYILLNSLPYYVGLVLGFPIEQNGLISSAPYIFYMITILSSAFFCQWLETKQVITVTRQRKLFICVSLVLAAASQFSVTYTGCDAASAILLVCISIGFMGIFYTSAGVNYLDIAPCLSGIIVSISNTVANCTGFIEPYVKAYFTRTGETRENWWYLFFTGSIVLVFGSVSYLFLGSGEAQPWDSDNSCKKEEKVSLMAETDLEDSSDN